MHFHIRGSWASNERSAEVVEESWIPRVSDLERGGLTVLA